MVLHKEDILDVFLIGPLALNCIDGRLFHSPLVALVLLSSTRLLALLWRVDL